MFKNYYYMIKLSAALVSLTMTSFSANANPNVKPVDDKIGVWSEWSQWGAVPFRGGSPVIEDRERYMWVDGDTTVRSQVQIRNLTNKDFAIQCTFITDGNGQSSDGGSINVGPHMVGTVSHSYQTGVIGNKWHWHFNLSETNIW
jgi:hypothetical protein